MSLLSPDALEAALRAIGEERYHIHHPFHHRLHGGKLTKGQVQAWALNRYYYQASIPAKDASLLARLPTPELRREWRRRLVDQVPEFLEEQEDVDALRHDQAEVQRQLQPARGEDQRGQRIEAGRCGADFGHAVCCSSRGG